MTMLDEFHKKLLIGAAWVAPFPALIWVRSVNLSAAVGIVALFFVVTTVLAYRERNASLTIMQAVIALLFASWAYAAWGRA